LEHYKGELPLWLAPVQVRVLPVKDALREYALAVKKQLEDCAIRAEIDDRGETLGKRIRQAEVDKVPYVLVAGEREAQQAAVSVRKRKEGDKGSRQLDDFIKEIREEINNKSR
jgi:threonyl-tRNA synthetase